MEGVGGKVSSKAGKDLRERYINVDGIPEKFCSKLLDSTGRISNIFTCKQIAEEGRRGVFGGIGACCIAGGHRVYPCVREYQNI